MKLQKLHGWPHPNALDGSSHEVVVDIKSEQAVERQELWNETASQLIEIEIDENEICEHSNFGRNRACQTTALHSPNLQARQESNLCRNDAHQVVEFCKNKKDC